MAPAMPCKISKTCMQWWPVAQPMRSNQNLRVSWKPVNSQDCVWKNLYRIIMRTILQERVTIHCSTRIWNTNLFPCFKLWKFRQQRQQWIRDGKNWRTFRRGTWPRSEVRKRWSMKQGRRAQKFILPHWWTSVIWRMLNWRQGTKNTKVELYFEVILWKTIQVLMQHSLNKDHQHLKWQPQKSWISSPDCQDARDKQQTQYPLIPRSKWKMLRNYCKFPNRNVQTFGFVYHDTWKIQAFLLSGICTVILWQDCHGKGNLRKKLLKYGWEKVSNWECLFVHREQGFFSSVYVDDF